VGFGVGLGVGAGVTAAGANVMPVRLIQLWLFPPACQVSRPVGCTSTREVY
jgi:hypothetical protein